MLMTKKDILKANGIAPHEPTKAPRPERRSQSHSLAGPSSGKRKQRGIKEEQSDEELDQDETEAQRKEAELEVRSLKPAICASNDGLLPKGSARSAEESQAGPSPREAREEEGQTRTETSLYAW